MQNVSESPAWWTIRTPAQVTAPRAAPGTFTEWVWSLHDIVATSPFPSGEVNRGAQSEQGKGSHMTLHRGYRFSTKISRIAL